MNDHQRKMKEKHEEIMQRVKDNNLIYKRLSKEGKKEMIKRILSDYEENNIDRLKYEQD